MRLRAHALEQRRATLVAKLDELADVTVDDTGSRAETRLVQMWGAAPGGGLAVLARFEYREAFRRSGPGLWDLTGYEYEYRQGTGRRAYHLHDAGFHAHCVDARRPRADHHYRAPEIDVFEAHEEFRSLYLSGEPVSCADLRSALRDELSSGG